MRRLLRWHPLLFAVCPILWLYGHNIGELSPRALWPPLGVALLFTGVLWLALFALTRRDAARAGLLTTLLVVLIFTYGHLYHVVADFAATISHWPFIFLGIWLVIAAAYCWGVARWRADAAPVTDGLGVAGIVLLAFSLIGIARFEWGRLLTARQEHRRARISQNTDIPTDALPNIYFIVLDSYAGPETMRRVYGFDNTPFLDALRARGFYVAEQSRANYCQTILSIPATLNLDYIPALTPLPDRRSTDRAPLERLVDDNLVCRTLKAYGYRTVLFPSSYEPINFPSDVDAEHIRGFGDFNIAVINSTPLLVCSLTAANTSFDAYAVHRRRILATFNGVPDALRLKGPIFVYAHILAPHQPLVFDELGNPITGDPHRATQSGRHWREAPDDAAAETRKYRGEVRYLNTLTLRLIDTILQKSTRPTAILLQADHGPGYLPDTEAELGQMSIPERYQILNACYFPGGKTDELYPAISPINTFRVLFNTYLHTRLPLRPERCYFSPFLRPYHFLDVTDATHYGPGAAMSADADTRRRLRDYMRR
ncbi:MAG TPA: sulfatase-like hydrolase/transferase [Armatimonadota bacterium]|nr:sulfatase-like hydrolase/transferase [Armatimonadota bacterium]HOS42515.1 sulfatase-like hydrolase/transferase [Armatimonadota bacterium]